MKRQLTISLLVLAVLLLAAPIAAVKTGRRVKRAATDRPLCPGRDEKKSAFAGSFSEQAD
jgi:hypothetical protein